jgi:hypothetical protein
MMNGISMQWKEILELSALILSIINALILIQNYLRDKASLAVDPIHPDIYQWWFELPEGNFEGHPTRRFGFLTYVGIGNRGLRKVALKSWRLFISNKAQLKKQELKPLTIQEPILKLGEMTKVFEVLGIKGVIFSSGDTTIDSGCSISGWAYFQAEVYGDIKWNPVIKNGVIKADFIVQDIFGGKAKTKIAFSKKDLAYIQEILPGIENIK